MKKKQENPQKSSLLGQLSALEIDGQLTTSVRRASYLRAICSSFGLQGARSSACPPTASSAQSQQPEFRNKTRHHTRLLNHAQPILHHLQAVLRGY